MIFRLILASAFVFAVLNLPNSSAQTGKKLEPGAILKIGDTDKDGKLDKDEFVRVSTKGPRFKDNPEAAKAAFDALDANKDGFLTLVELAKALPRLKAGKAKEKENGAPKAVPGGFNDQPTQEQLAFFEKKIRPVLIEQCYSCHSIEKPEKVKAELLLDTRDGLRTGGENGPIVIPGSPAKSMLVRALHYKDENLQMPPKSKLSDQVIADFETWITMGAPDPREGKKNVIKNDIDIEKGKEFWSYQKPKATPVPSVKDTQWPKNDTDNYVGILTHGLELCQNLLSRQKQAA